MLDKTALSSLSESRQKMGYTRKEFVLKKILSKANISKFAHCGLFYFKRKKILCTKDLQTIYAIRKTHQMLNRDQIKCPMRYIPRNRERESVSERA
jgi:hypothetical protein